MNGVVRMQCERAVALHEVASRDKALAGVDHDSELHGDHKAVVREELERCGNVFW